MFRFLEEEVNYIYGHDVRSVKYELMKYDQIRKELSLLKIKIKNILMI